MSEERWKRIDDGIDRKIEQIKNEIRGQDEEIELISESQLLISKQINSVLLCIMESSNKLETLNNG
jgi:hypothetical protein